MGLCDLVGVWRKGEGRKEDKKMAYHIASEIVPPRTRTWVKAPITTATTHQYPTQALRQPAGRQKNG